MLTQSLHRPKDRLCIVLDMFATKLVCRCNTLMRLWCFTDSMSVCVFVYLCVYLYTNIDFCVHLYTNRYLLYMWFSRRVLSLVYVFRVVLGVSVWALVCPWTNRRHFGKSHLHRCARLVWCSVTSDWSFRLNDVWGLVVFLSHFIWRRLA